MQMGLGNRFQGEKYPPGFRMGSWRGTEEGFLPYFLDLRLPCLLLNFGYPAPSLKNFWYAALSRIFLFGRQVSGYTRSGSSQMFLQIIWTPFPNMICSVAFHQVYNFVDRHCWLCFYHVIGMAFARFHISDNYVMFLAYLI